MSKQKSKMSTPKLVAISGHKGSGKDTLGLHLQQAYGYKHVSFAAALKDMVSETYEIDRDAMDDRNRKDAPLLNMPVIPTDRFTLYIHSLLQDELRTGFWTPRALCILEGSVKRSVYGNYWVKRVLEQVMSDDGKYVITDMRYKSEADTLKMFIPDAKLVRIDRPDNIITTQDPSERDLDLYKFDYTIRNASTIGDLYNTADELLSGGNI